MPIKSAYAGILFLFCFGIYAGPADAASTLDLAGAMSAALQKGLPENESQLAALLEQSLQSYEKIKDYRSTFEKRELSHGSLGEKETIFFKFEKPFKIFMHWSNTRKKGLQVLYERGKHHGKLAIHQPGLLLGLAPVIFLDRSSPWVREGSEAYDIEDAGIGTFLNDFSEMVLKGMDQGKIRTALEESETGSWVDVFFPGTEPGTGYFAYRVKVRFDKETRLPVEMSLYDWNNQVTGIYEYKDLGVDIGPQDQEFQKVAQKKLYRLFQPEVPAAKINNFSTKSKRLVN